MSYNHENSEKNGTILVNYEKLLDALIDEMRQLLIEKKKNVGYKSMNEQCLFDEFIYINSLRNSATTEEEYKEAYETLRESIQKFREGSA